MNRQILQTLCVATVITTLLLVGCSNEPETSLDTPQVLVFLRDRSFNPKYMLTHEVGVMLSMLEEAGLQAVIATQSEDSYSGSDTPLESDILLQDVQVADYVGFLLPCMAAGAPGPIADDAVEMVAEAAAQNKPVAAQDGSIFTLAQAGLLDGKHYAFESAAIPEGIHDGTGVVQDGNTITSATCTYKARSSGRPDDTPELTQKLIEAIAH